MYGGDLISFTWHYLLVYLSFLPPAGKDIYMFTRYDTRYGEGSPPE